MFWTSMTTETSKILHFQSFTSTAQTVGGFLNFHELYPTLAPKKSI